MTLTGKQTSACALELGDGSQRYLFIICKYGAVICSVMSSVCLSVCPVWAPTFGSLDLEISCCYASTSWEYLGHFHISISSSQGQGHRSNKAFIEVWLRPGVTTPLVPYYGPLWPNVASSIKPEVHNVLQCCRRRTEPRPQGICTQNFMTIGPAVPEICLQTDINRHTDKLITILLSPTGAE